MCKDYLISLENGTLDRLSAGLLWRIVVKWTTQKVMNTCQDRSRHTLCNFVQKKNHAVDHMHG